MDKITKALSQVELLADDIINDQAQKIDLDRKRHKNREVYNYLTKNKSSLGTSKQWLCVGNMFIKVTQNEAKNLITDDLSSLDKGIDELHEELKRKVDNLRELEGKPEVSGFKLKPLKKDEILALKTGFKI